MIGEAEILFALYGEVTIPPAVAEELLSTDGPGSTRRWIKKAPKWLRVEKASRETAEKLQALDRGERQAIHLAKETGSGLLIIDERDGRRVANELELRFCCVPKLWGKVSAQIQR